MLKLKTFKPLSLLTILGLGFLAFSCSSTSYNNFEPVENANLYTQGLYLDKTSQSLSIAKKTLSLEFKIENKSAARTEGSSSDNQNNIAIETIFGTGWIYDKKGDDYFVATNLHVASILSFENKNNVSRYVDTGFSNVSYGEIFETRIGFVSQSSLNSTNNTAIAPSYVVVNKPTIFYTALEDSNFVSEYGEKEFYFDNKKFNPIIDFAILKYHFPKDQNYYTEIAKQHEEVLKKYEPKKDSKDQKEARREEIRNNPNINLAPINGFIEFLNFYESDPTVIFKQALDSIDFTKQKYYLGGFASLPQNLAKPDKNLNRSTGSIRWYALSNFTMNTLATANFQFQANEYLLKGNEAAASPISYFSKNANVNDPLTYNYLTTAREGYIYGTSFPGASGGALYTEIDNQLVVVGIYWGSVQFEINNNKRALGAFSFLHTSTNGPKLKGYNILHSLDEKIKSV